MARLVVLAVLLATAAYAAGETKVLKLKSCTDTDDQCKMCNDTAAVEYTVEGDNKCQASASGSYKAKCGGTNGAWELHLYDAANCDATTATHSISASAKCFHDTKGMRAQVTSFENSTTVKVRVCKVDATDCTTEADTNCPVKTITVPKMATDCGRLDGTSGLYYTAKVVGASNDKLTLMLYATAAECANAKLPVFTGKDMAKDTCTTFKQNLTAESCETVTTTAASTTADNSTNGNGTNENTSDTTTEAGGSAAVSSVLALFLAACAVCMM